MANGRSSQDERKLENGAGAAPASNGIHPAFYIALWIALSSSVILFNKWVLASAKFNFREFSSRLHRILGMSDSKRLYINVDCSAVPHDMAHGVRYRDDPDSGSLHHHSGLPP
jgi:hypothetical protein